VNYVGVTTNTIKTIQYTCQAICRLDAGDDIYARLRTNSNSGTINFYIGKQGTSLAIYRIAKL
jgi:hypothetical protein